MIGSNLSVLDYNLSCSLNLSGHFFMMLSNEAAWFFGLRSAFGICVLHSVLLGSATFLLIEIE